MKSLRFKRSSSKFSVNRLGLLKIAIAIFMSTAIVSFAQANMDNEQEITSSPAQFEENSCVDDEKECWKWAKRGLCNDSEHGLYMKMKCKKSCILCGEETCQDVRDACSRWTSAGYCTKETYRKFMNLNCKRSCKLCPDQLLIKPSTVAEPVDGTNATASEIVTTTVTQFSEWTTWTECTRTCGRGSKQRSRHCRFGECSATQAQPCVIRACPTPASTTNSIVTETLSTSHHINATSPRTPTTGSTTETTARRPAIAKSTEADADQFTTESTSLSTHLSSTDVSLTTNKTEAAKNEISITKSVSLTVPSFTTTTTAAVASTGQVPFNTDFQPGPSKPKCVDQYKECENISDFCGIVEKVARNCPRTCGFCDRDRVTTTAISTTPTFPTSAIPTEESCEDTFANCVDLSTECTNPDSVQFLQVTCKKTCGFCSTTTSASNVLSTEVVGTECVDSNELCNGWAQYGFCNSTIYPEMTSYMKDNCKKTCRVCDRDSWSEWSECSATCGGGYQNRTKLCNSDDCLQPYTKELRGCNVYKCLAPSPTCKDSFSEESCLAYKARGVCNTALIAALCAKTCDMCKTEKDNSLKETTADGSHSSYVIDNDTANATCVDRHKICGNWSKRGFCTFTYTTYMKEHCPKSCNLCGVWNPWSSWSLCNASCAGGVMNRNRTCQTSDCEGKDRESRTCNDFECPVCYDQSPGCFDMKQAGKCEVTFWKIICKQSCGLCQPKLIKGPCFDTRRDCEYLRKTGKCLNSAVARACPLSCGKCPGYQSANSGASQCADAHANCPSAALLGRCSEPNVLDVCPLSCGRCTGIATGRPDQTPTTTLTAGANSCDDKWAVCQDIKSNCGQNQVVTEYCPRTCGKCQDDCVDSDSLCPNLAALGQCQYPIVADYCRRSCDGCRYSSSLGKLLSPEAACEDQIRICGNCTSRVLTEPCAKICAKCARAPAKDVCKDRNSRCPRYAQEGQCQKMFISFLCPLSCDKCSELNSDEPVDTCVDAYPTSSCDLLRNKCDTALVRMYCQRTCGECRALECIDQNPANCGILQKMGMCSLLSFKRNCPKTCKVCGETPAAEMPAKPTLEVKQCQDEREDCEIFLASGQCDLYVIKSVCKMTCSVCGNQMLSDVIDSDAPCMDSSDQWCLLIAKQQQCRKTKNARFLCAKSCNNCPRLLKDKTSNTACKYDDPAECELHRDNCFVQAIANKCRWMCGRCSATDQEGMSNGNLPLGPTIAKECRDYYDECKNYKSFCYQSYISEMCRDTCGECFKPTSTHNKPTNEPHVTKPKVSGTWSTWGMWSLCTKTCGVGNRTRDRSCEGVSGCIGESTMFGSCGKDACYGRALPNQETCIDRSESCSVWMTDPIRRCAHERYRAQMEMLCAYSCGHCTPNWFWSEWSECSAPCGNGTQNRTKVCKVEGKCTGEVQSNVDQRHCLLKQCNNSWSTWSEWSDCSTSCGSGSQWRQRLCLSEDKDVCEGLASEEALCQNRSLCPEREQWSPWSECSVSCGNGTKTRSLECLTNSKNTTCSGAANQTTTCNEQSCVEWLVWSNWSECNATCGREGNQTRSRICLNAKNCNGIASEYRACLSRNVCTGWTEWSEYSKCSVSCGKGFVSRRRKCQNDRASTTVCTGNATQSVPCNLQICPDVGLWSEWGEFKPCSATCGDGEKKRRRMCLDGIPGSGGCAGPSYQREKCSSIECPTGMWMDWSSWSNCSLPCGVGVRSRDRLCKDGLPGQSGCPGLKEKVERCNTHDCPYWTSWQPWSACNASCGTVGERIRNKHCVDPLAKGFVSNSECPTKSEITEKEICNVSGCLAWSTWSAWDKCSASCGTGWRSRHRRCQNGQLGDESCRDDLDSEQKRCNTWDCPSTCHNVPLEVTQSDNASSHSFVASSHVPGFSASEAQLLSSRAWCPDINDTERWLQINLEHAKNVSGVFVSGFVNNGNESVVPKFSWVSEFAIEYSTDNKTFTPCKNNVDEMRIFKGPDGSLLEHGKERFFEPVAGQHWRVYILSSIPENGSCLKIELRTCDMLSNAHMLHKETAGKWGSADGPL